ncbi:uncharacterized protein LOC127280272 isoform X8 [Leptopilina boulardi]|uniref:uncharacterized protein LOC127280272 isoform X6 n=1 Tax=Leptopilina boulardi TaxID=63433 RepID=UPI0021F51162|nr:uncharacterized protein LOC127280272 isoform X6 [Leptopilina boulardi]XP_051159132.1 uncharacterized protein LOC127280272 isoform X7 [Leptopilina boulardi]XP_051159133.1 uncharacterized protein LOC127280272 isoform X8 [Leptopilina boulardi]
MNFHKQFSLIYCFIVFTTIIMKATYISLLLFVGYANFGFSSPVPEYTPPVKDDAKQPAIKRALKHTHGVFRIIEKLILSDAPKVESKLIQDISDSVSSISLPVANMDILQDDILNFINATKKILKHFSDVGGNVGNLTVSIINTVKDLLQVLDDKFTKFAKYATNKELISLKDILDGLQNFLLNEIKEIENNYGQEKVQPVKQRLREALLEPFRGGGEVEPTQRGSLLEPFRGGGDTDGPAQQIENDNLEKVYPVKQRLREELLEPFRGGGEVEPTQRGSLLEPFRGGGDTDGPAQQIENDNLEKVYPVKQRLREELLEPFRGGGEVEPTQRGSLLEPFRGGGDTDGPAQQIENDNLEKVYPVKQRLREALLEPFRGGGEVEPTQRGSLLEPFRGGGDTDGPAQQIENDNLEEIHPEELPSQPRDLLLELNSTIHKYPSPPSN